MSGERGKDGGAFLRKLSGELSSLPAVKICGFTVLSEALAACEAGADAVGINFYPRSKRFISFEECESWLPALPARVSRIGIFVNDDINKVAEIVGTHPKTMLAEST